MKRCKEFFAHEMSKEACNDVTIETPFIFKREDTGLHGHVH